MSTSTSDERGGNFGWILSEAAVHGAFNDAGNFRDETKALVRAGLLKKGRRFRDDFGSQIQAYHITGKGRRTLRRHYSEVLEIVATEGVYYPMPRGPLRGNPVWNLPVTAPTQTTAEARGRRFGRILGVEHRGGDKWTVTVQQKGWKNPIPNRGPVPRQRKWLAQAITRKGKLGGKGFLTRSFSEQKALLDRCVREYGYRSCLGSVMVLRRIPHTVARFGKRLETLKRYLVKSYGGSGSLGPRKLPNPHEPGHFTLIPELTDDEPIVVKTNPEFEKELLDAAVRARARARKKKVRGRRRSGLSSVMRTAMKGT